MVLYPINPSTLAKYRETFTPSGAKDDPTDAELAVDLITRHPERFSPLKPQSVGMRKLIGLVEQRDKFVSDQGRVVNRLGHALRQYYPQVLEWFSEHNTLVFCDFLNQWPTLNQVKRARKASLERFFRRVISTGRRNTFVKFLCRRMKLQCLSGSFVEPPGDLIQVSLRVYRQVSALGEVLS